MAPLQIALWILVFAVVTAVLYGIGLSKSMHRERDLMALLFSKGERKIRKALQKKETMTHKELEALLAGTRSTLFYSRRQMTVQDPKLFTKTLLKAMVEKGILLESNQNQQKIYRLQNN